MKELKKKTRDWIKGHFLCGCVMGLMVGFVVGLIFNLKPIIAAGIMVGIYLFKAHEKIEEWEFKRLPPPG